MGRFLQEDIYRGDGLNLYAYCANNPVVYYDPSGHATEYPDEKPKMNDTHGNSAVNGNNSGIGSDNKNTVSTDTYVFGNATKPGNACPKQDFGVENDSDLVSAQTPYRRYDSR